MYDKPLPVPDVETAPFWGGCREHRLMIQLCRSTGQYLFPPASYCPGSFDAPEWVEASGIGVVFSWIVVRHPVPMEIYARVVPYIVALITLQEGCRIPAQIVDCDIGNVYAGMNVKVDYRDVTPEVTLPVFRPIRS